MAATHTAEAKELALVDKVELRIALTDTDQKFENVLNTYLAPLLLKLASEHVSVRNKVISICQHINTRTKPQNIRLPVTALLKQFKAAETPLIRHFDLLYIQQGVTRLEPSEIADLFPLLISGFSKNVAGSASNGSTLLNLLFRSVLGHKFPLKGSKEDLALRTDYEVSHDDATDLSFWFGKLLLLRLGSGEAAAGHPGLTNDEHSFLMVQGRPDVWNGAAPTGLNLTEVKITVLKCLASGLFTDAERQVPVLFASADPNSRIAEAAEDLMKRVAPNVLLEDKDLVNNLYRYYFGSPSYPPARAALRIKILNLLSRSILSTTFPELIIKLVQNDMVQDARDSGEHSISNREGIKLRSAVIGYLNFMVHNGIPQHIDAIGRPVINLLQNFVENNTDTSLSAETSSVRGRSFEVIGLLARVNVALVAEPQLGLLRWLFQALTSEPHKDVMVSIDEALSAIIQPLTNSAAIEPQVRELLLKNMHDNSRNMRNVRFASLRFANKCLPYHDVVARFIDLLALSGSAGPTHEVEEEAKKGLDPYWYRLSSNADVAIELRTSSAQNEFPKFADMIDYAFSEHREETFTDKLLCASTAAYCRQLLLLEALSAASIVVDMSADWTRKLDLMVINNEDARAAVRRYITIGPETEMPSSAVDLYWRGVALTGLQSGSIGSSKICAQAALELCSLASRPVLEHLARKALILEPVVSDNDVDIRSAAARAFGLLTSYAATTDTQIGPAFDCLLFSVKAWKEAVGAAVNRTHGAITAVSTFVSHRSIHYPDDSLAAELLSTLLPALLKIVQEGHQHLLVDGALVAIGQLASFGVISTRSIAETTPLKKLIEAVAEKAKAGSEKAIKTLGHMSMIVDGQDDELEVALLQESLFKLHEVRQAETQFAVGEAMTCFMCRWNSKAMVSELDYDGAPPLTAVRPSFAVFLDQILADSGTTKPSLKKASVIWLLCFLQFCGRQEEVQSRLTKFQVAFKRCLSDRDELVQEAASRGLGLVYEQGNRGLKDDLVRDLIGSFSSNRAETAGTVTADTELFEPGALPTGNSESITTYKDIMSLASEVGDSSLVYRFMSLASNNAIWSSRAAFGRYGLSNVLSDSSVDGYLASNPKLYPKLYRYRFDPNTNVRRSMNDIWNALVKDSSATIEIHFDAIITDLLVSIVDREWRVRQASCAAIADLVQGRKKEQVAPYLDRIWTLTFKVLDDIKESVRTAAAGLSRTLTSMLLRTLEASQETSENASKMLDSVLTFLLSPAGLESGAEEVQSFSLTTLLQIVKKSKGAILQPFIPQLLERLLSLLTFLEPQAVNYVHLNAEKYNLSAKDIDNARLSSIRNSPLMEAIERCIDMLDEKTMTESVGKIQIVMRTAIGMPSKVGCSRVVVSLATRRMALFTPHADVVLGSLEKQVLDRNETVCSSYAVALGYVARCATDRKILQIADYIRKLYFDDEDERRRAVSGEMVSAIAKHATDRFKSLASAFLPLVFIARNDVDERMKKMYKEIWDDAVGGPRAASLYLNEIVALCSQHLDSKRWTLKHTAALAISDCVQSVQTSKGDINEAEGQKIWPALKIALADKSWSGKEKVLDGFVCFVKHARMYWFGRPDVAQEICKISLREAKRRNPDYRAWAVSSLAQIVSARQDVDMWDGVVEIVESVREELLTNSKATTKMDLDNAKDEDRKKPHEAVSMHIRTLTGANEALFHAVVGGFKDMYFGTSETERSAALHELGTEDCGQDYLKTMMGGAPSTSLAASSSDHTSFGASKLNANTGTPLEQVVRRTAERFSTALAFAEECTSLERSGGSTSTAPLSTAIFHGVRSALETLRGQGRARVAGVLDLAGSRLEALLLIGPPAADSAESARMHCAEAVLAWARCLRVAAIDINVSVSVSVSVSEPHPADTSTGDDAATPSAINNAITNTTSTRRALLQRLTDREASEPSPVVRKVLVQARRTLLDSAAHNT